MVRQPDHGTQRGFLRPSTGQRGGGRSRLVDDPHSTTPVVAVGHRLIDHPRDDPEIWAPYLLLPTWDRLSPKYVFCLVSGGVISPVPGTVSGLRCEPDGPFGLTIDPYQFVAHRLNFPSKP
jgi:hypothetical protein